MAEATRNTLPLLASGSELLVRAKVLLGGGGGGGAGTRLTVRTSAVAASGDAQSFSASALAGAAGGVGGSWAVPAGVAKRAFAFGRIEELILQISETSSQRSFNCEIRLGYHREWTI